MIKKLFPALLPACIILAVYSCKKDERDPCLQPRTTLLRTRFYHHADTGTANLDTFLPNPQFLPLTGSATQYYYGGQKRINAFAFSLSDVADTCRWIIRPDSANALQDTITFRYDHQLRFLSNACGYTNFYNLGSVAITHHALDSAIIARGDITTDANVVHVRLYF